MKKTLSACLLCLSLPAFSGGIDETILIESAGVSNIHVGAYGGYGNVNGGYKDDGKIAQGRLSLGIHAIEFNIISFGLEAGVQSGNTMRLSADSALIDELGGLPIQATLKPSVDALITAKGQLFASQPLFIILKGGIAYRQLQLEDRSSSQDGLRKIAGEFQAGLGFNITEQAMLTAYYQGIYGGSDAKVSINWVGDATISHIPTQQSGFLGVEYSF